MKGTTYELIATVELGKCKVLDVLYQGFENNKYAIFTFKVTCVSDPYYHLKYILLNNYPFKAFDYKNFNVRGIYQIPAEHTIEASMFLKALPDIVDLDDNPTCPGKWATRQQVETFESLHSQYLQKTRLAALTADLYEE